MSLSVSLFSGIERGRNTPMAGCIEFREILSSAVVTGAAPPLRPSRQRQIDTSQHRHSIQPAADAVESFVSQPSCGGGAIPVALALPPSAVHDTSAAVVWGSLARLVAFGGPESRQIPHSASDSRAISSAVTSQDSPSCLLHTMPSPTKGRASRPRGSEEEFVLFLQGIPAHCRWQELKDLVRQTALHIRQAVVYDDHHGFPTGLGQIIVKNEDEAWRTYHRLSTNGWEGQSLVVTLARTSAPTCPIAGPTKSPTPCVVSPTYVANYSTPPQVPQSMAVPPSPISPEPVISSGTTYHGPEYGPLLSPMGLPQPFITVFPDPLACQIPPSAGTTTPAPPSPMYAPYAMGMYHHPRRAHHPKSTYTYYAAPLPYAPAAATTTTTATSATRPPHRRTLFIQNLSPATTPRALRSLLSDAGTIDHCEMPADRDSARCKGFARVSFRTGDEAKRAVALFNNAVFLGSKIRVKIDRSIQVAYTPAVGGLVQEGASVHTPPLSGAASAASSDVEDARASRPSSPKKKPVDRCGPLVVNGSGVGPRAVVT
ncbi:RNA binding protein [Aspergillus terreus]|uniref:RNA binding protein n=1 Tax=Aspergillus terreus TaxID=33178 RepID=A0A5M3YUY0_ASPTE|nr:hypothetical protein ATETN484_0004060900 [Aspergillus terreus]GFF13498.1 RNA binding protein [Aspergillus terreus]